MRRQAPESVAPVYAVYGRTPREQCQRGTRSPGARGSSSALVSPHHAFRIELRMLGVSAPSRVGSNHLILIGAKKRRLLPRLVFGSVRCPRTERIPRIVHHAPVVALAGVF